MSRNMPTLKGLRAFEEAYLCGSYTEAAKALNVQQPAISYQIKRLEEDLGTELFARHNGRLQPTPQAHDLFETVSRAFDDIRKTARKMRPKVDSTSFTIATYPGIGTYWLAPRLSQLSERLETSAKVVTLVKDADLLKEDADCWILFGAGNWPDFDSELILKEEVCPVASPSLAEKIRAPDGSFDLNGVTIIEQEDPESRWLNWASWQRRSQEDWHLPSDRMVVNDHGLALHMALSGAGLTLGWIGIIGGLLEGKSLERLSTELVTSNSGYWLLGRPGFFETANGHAIRKTLLEL